MASTPANPRVEHGTAVGPAGSARFLCPAPLLDILRREPKSQAATYSLWILAALLLASERSSSWRSLLRCCYYPGSDLSGYFDPGGTVVPNAGTEDVTGLRNSTSGAGPSPIASLACAARSSGGCSELLTAVRAQLGPTGPEERRPLPTGQIYSDWFAD